jgi:XapX domain-containing protein
MMKPFLGLALAFAIGFGCRAFGIPSPALQSLSVPCSWWR